MPKIILKKGKFERIMRGHPWVYGNEIDSTEGDPQPGDIVDVVDAKQKFIGKGYFNPQSQITVRLLTRNKNEDVDKEFFRKRIKSSFDYRKKLGYTENFRVVFGEGDFLPGLVIDKFGSVFVIQTLSLGMDKWKNDVVSILNELFSPSGIYERNDVPVRELEGLTQQKGFLSEPFNTQFLMEECGAKFLVDVENGQKTGFFLDQKENRLSLEHLVKDAEVLDCFCYTGSFSVFAARFGAKKITCLDDSADALTQAKHNIALNDFSGICEFKKGNAFDLLPEMVKEKKHFDTIILDPPAFTKSRSGVESAVRGYKEINLRAMKLLSRGGFLFTFSCSHFMTPSLFFEMLMEAASDSNRTIRQVDYLSQSKDHPVVWNIDETSYLKGMILEVR